MWRHSTADYSPEEDQIFLIAEGRENLRIGETTLSHELVHAWQDQRYNLSSEKLSPRLRDEANARIGIYFLKFQPYSDGPEFVRLVRTVGGWKAVNELYERPPQSTEQVIHVETTHLTARR